VKAASLFDLVLNREPQRWFALFMALAACSPEGQYARTLSTGGQSGRAAGGVGLQGGAGDPNQAVLYGDVRNCVAVGDVCPLLLSSYPVCVEQKCGFECNSGFFDCDRDPKSGCEVDLDRDPNNCGRCGRHCSDNLCTNGRCSPVTLAEGQDHPRSLAINKTHAYWTSQGAYRNPAVLRVPLEGGAVSPGGPGHLGNTWGIALGASDVYWTGNDGGDHGLFWGALDFSGTVERLDGGSNNLGLVIDEAGGSLYWVQNSGIRTMALRGVSGSAKTLVSGQIEAQDIAADDLNVYWVNHTATGSLMKLAKGSTTATPLAANQALPSGIAVYQNNVYWANTASGEILSVPRTGGTPTALVSNLRRPWAVAVDASGVYWSTEEGTVSSLSEPASPIQELARFEGKPIALALDASSVYWANFESGTLRKVAK